VNARGLLNPEALGQVFSLDRRAPPPDLAHLIETHWTVSWDLRGREPYRSEVLPHPCVHLVFESRGEAAVHGVAHARFERRLSGAGWAMGTKFRPGGFAPFMDRPVSELTDRVLALRAVLGPDAAALEQAPPEHPEQLLPRLHAFLRARLSTEPDPRRELVQAIAAEMLAADPGERVADFAARHHVSERTLQRLFAAYVGIGPKWVLRRYRLHEAIERLGGRRDVDWARFALDLGYYDQAHFNRDFRSLVGRTPLQYGRPAGDRVAAASG
jgi:AraC-like DNA-binding protein